MLIELRRHSVRAPGSDCLSPEGIALAKMVGGLCCQGKGYTLIAGTTLFRTAQTAAALAEGAGDFSVTELRQFRTLNTWRDWQSYFKENDCVIVPEEPLIKAESRRMALDLIDELDGLPDSTHLLAIGHTPLIECLIFGLFNRVTPPLRELDGVIIEYEGGEFRFIEELRDGH